MLIGSRRLIYVMTVLVGVLVADVMVTGGVSPSARDVLIALSAVYLGADAYKKTKAGS